MGGGALSSLIPVPVVSICRYESGELIFHCDSPTNSGSISNITSYSMQVHHNSYVLEGVECFCFRSTNYEIAEIFLIVLT